MEYVDGGKPVVSVETAMLSGAPAMDDVFLFPLHLKCTVSLERAGKK